MPEHVSDGEAAGILAHEYVHVIQDAYIKEITNKSPLTGDQKLELLLRMEIDAWDDGLDVFEEIFDEDPTVAESDPDSLISNILRREDHEEFERRIRELYKEHYSDYYNMLSLNVKIQTIGAQIVNRSPNEIRYKQIKNNFCKKYNIYRFFLNTTPLYEFVVGISPNNKIIKLDSRENFNQLILEESIKITTENIANYVEFYYFISHIHKKQHKILNSINEINELTEQNLEKFRHVIEPMKIQRVGSGFIVDFFSYVFGVLKKWKIALNQNGIIHKQSETVLERGLGAYLPLR
jgi:hypothetical protein